MVIRGYSTKFTIQTITNLSSPFILDQNNVNRFNSTGMGNTILVVPDKFKGTLTSAQVCSSIANGWKQERPDDRVIELPMSDGGDGFGAVMNAWLNGESRRVETIDAAQRPVSAEWWINPARSTAIIDSANIIGLAMIEGRAPHPFERDTHGLGQALKAAADAGTTECLVGIGGSATNDAGFGMARALGWEFLNEDGVEIRNWHELNRLKSIKQPDDTISMRVRVAVDVQNILLGEEGCTRIFGPQKGLLPSDYTKTDAAHVQLAKVASAHFDNDHHLLPGSGAAGGLGFGLTTFANGTLESGFELYASISGLNEHIRHADLVITGEGSLDLQSIMGKGPGEIIRLSRQFSKPCIAIAGNAENREKLEPHLDAIYTLLPDFCSVESAFSDTSNQLTRLARKAAMDFSISAARPHSDRPIT